MSKSLPIKRCIEFNLCTLQWIILEGIVYYTSALKAKDSDCCLICREYRGSLCDYLQYKAEDMDSVTKALKPPKTKEKRGQPVVSGLIEDENEDLDRCSYELNATNASRISRRSRSPWYKRHWVYKYFCSSWNWFYIFFFCSALFNILTMFSHM